MKIKKLTYLAILAINVGLFAADNRQLVPALQPGLAVAAQGPFAIPTQDQILQQLSNARAQALAANPIPPQTIPWGSTIARYAGNMARNSLTASGILLPAAWYALKDTYGFGVPESAKKYLAATAMLAAAVGGYTGWKEATTAQNTEKEAQRVRQQLQDTQVDLERAADMVVDASKTIANLQRIHGSLEVLRANHADMARQLDDLQTAGQAATALKQIDQLEATSQHDIALLTSIATAMASTTHPALRRALLTQIRGQMELSRQVQAARGSVLGEVAGNRAFATERHEELLNGLRQQAARLALQNQDLFPQLETFIATMQGQYDSEQRALEMSQQQVREAVSQQQQQAAPPMTLLNRFGYPGIPSAANSFRAPAASAVLPVVPSMPSIEEVD